jgi:hypothetical protein
LTQASLGQGVQPDKLYKPASAISPQSRGDDAHNRKSRPGDHRTALFRNCRFVTGSIA